VSDRSQGEFWVHRKYAELVSYMVDCGGCEAESEEEWRLLVFEPAYGQLHGDANDVEDTTVVHITQGEMAGGGYSVSESMAGLGIPFQHYGSRHYMWAEYRSCSLGKPGDWGNYDYEGGYCLEFGNDSKPIPKHVEVIGAFHHRWLKIGRINLGAYPYVPKDGSVGAWWLKYVVERKVEEAEAAENSVVKDMSTQMAQEIDADIIKTLNAGFQKTTSALDDAQEKLKQLKLKKDLLAWSAKKKAAKKKAKLEKLKAKKKLVEKVVETAMVQSMKKDFNIDYFCASCEDLGCFQCAESEPESSCTECDGSGCYECEDVVGKFLPDAENGTVCKKHGLYACFSCVPGAVEPDVLDIIYNTD